MNLRNKIIRLVAAMLGMKIRIDGGTCNAPPSSFGYDVPWVDGKPITRAP